MGRLTPVSASWLRLAAPGGIALVAGIASAILLCTSTPGSAPTHPSLFVTAWISCLGWWLAQRFGWKLCGLAGSTILLFHLALSFHYAHSWSMDHAYDRVEEASGTGSGLYVSLTFSAIWFLESLLQVISPRVADRRPAWLRIAIQAFLAFIVFNATVVFASWPTRCLFGLLFLEWFWQLGKRLLPRNPAIDKV